MSELVLSKQKFEDVRGLLQSMKQQLSLALPRHMTADRLIRVALTSIMKTPDILNCTRESLAGAIIQSAQLGLEPDGVMGHAYLIPFFDGKAGVKKVQMMVGYKGLVDLARRSGQLIGIEARAVYSDDEFKFQFGLHQDLSHTPGGVPTDAKLTHVYAIARLRDGGIQFDVMTKDEVDAIRNRSKAKGFGPWVTDYAEMAKKTVLRRLCKLLPSSVEMQKAVALDEQAEVGVDQGLSAIFEAEVRVKDPSPKVESPSLPEEKEPEEDTSQDDSGPSRTDYDIPPEVLEAVNKEPKQVPLTWAKVVSIAVDNGFEGEEQLKELIAAARMDGAALPPAGSPMSQDVFRLIQTLLTDKVMTPKGYFSKRRKDVKHG